ncbi:MAG: hypothetical protein KGJ57_22735 [Sphingomonadales bacterium]|nr:hypothetical protein [Sphingomonadales bacterium]MDE2172202.1 hypothetical protein [Sphingomonadales bacterium]
MKFFLSSAALLLPAMMAVPAVANAQSASATGTVSINGSVAGRCSFTLDNGVISLGELSQGSTGAAPGHLDAAKVNGQQKTLTGWCNGSGATMSVLAEPLWNTATASAGFDNRVDYTATATANSQNATDTSTDAGAIGTTGSAGTPVNVNMFTGNVVVTLSNSSTPTSGLMVAGNYSGQVVVTLTPTVAL